MSKKTEVNYPEMTIEELEAHIQALSRQKDIIRQEMLDAHAVLDTKNEQLAAQRRLESLGDSERAALAQALGVVGIPSEEVVNNV